MKYKFHTLKLNIVCIKFYKYPDFILCNNVHVY